MLTKCSPSMEVWFWHWESFHMWNATSDEPALWALELLSLVSCRAVDLRISDGDKPHNLTAGHWCFWIDCAVLVPLETRFTDGRGWDNQKGQVWTTGGPECFQELASLRVSKKLVAWSEIIRIISARENPPGTGPVSSFLGMIWSPRLLPSSAQALPRGCRC